MSDDALDTVLHPWEDNVRRLSAGIVCEFYNYVLQLPYIAGNFRGTKYLWLSNIETFRGYIFVIAACTAGI